MAPSERPVIEISIDGHAYPLPAGSTLTAAALLQLAGLDPSGYDLAEIHGGSTPQKLADSDLVHLHAGQRFLSVRESATVA